MDLAEVHVKAIEVMMEKNESYTLNVGTGKGTSVLELIKVFERVNQLKLNYKIGRKRKGDIEQIYAATDLVEKTLHWKAKRNIEEAMKDAWKWQGKLS